MFVNLVGLCERYPCHFFQVFNCRDGLDERRHTFSDERKGIVFGVTFHQLLNHLHADDNGGKLVGTQVRVDELCEAVGLDEVVQKFFIEKQDQFVNCFESFGTNTGLEVVLMHIENLWKKLLCSVKDLLLLFRLDVECSPFRLKLCSHLNLSW